MIAAGEFSTNVKADDHLTPAPWIRRVLMAAAAYNLIWGGLAVVIPEQMLSLMGFDPAPVYPELWQCIGMIVGVYGIGYAIAARNAFVHWPIVLVGLLGKVFGPIGFASAVLKDRLPASMGWTILTNDLIWWIPFTIILWRAARMHQCCGQRLSVAPPALPIDPIGRMMSQRGATIAELSRRNPLLLVFLRHSGCTFCREALADLARQRDKIEQQGTKIAIVHMGQQEPALLLEKYGLTDLHCFRDPTGTLYETFGLKLGGVSQLLGPKVWLRGARVFFSGHGLGKLDGNGFRMPGVFLLRNGQIVRCFRHLSAADRPDYVALATTTESAACDSEAEELAAG